MSCWILNKKNLFIMGALTLKNFPFELRGWEVHKFRSFDPTDNYLSSTLIYLNKNEIVQIEPFLTNYSNNNWLSDKARHYFDSIFKAFSENKKIKIAWLNLYNQILIKIYLFEHCRRYNSKNYLFTIVFNYLSLDLLGMLNFILQSYTFICLKQASFYNSFNNNLECNFQLNNFLNQKSLTSSNLGFLITTNPRYESYTLNLNLRQRVFKKNFKCILVGSLINLTFPVSFLGTNTNIIKSITEGNNFVCQNFKFSNNAVLICNTELFKRNDNQTIIQFLKFFFYTEFFNKAWHGFNILSSTINETGIFAFNQTLKLKLKDLNNFSSIYLINVTTHKMSNFKRIIELQLLQKRSFYRNNLKQKLAFDQNYKKDNNFKFSNKSNLNYLYIPTTVFYENNETYFNTQGLIKRTVKINAETKSNWQILRKFIKYLKKNKFIFFSKKDNQNLFFNSNQYYDFKNYVNFYYYPTKNITNLGYYLNTKNKTFVLDKSNLNFKTVRCKYFATKLKYWMNDFFNGSKDPYSINSIILNGCSKQIKNQTTNFF